VLFGHYDKMKGHWQWGENYKWWDHMYRGDIPATAPSGLRRLLSHHFILVILIFCTAIY
jgi:hypothetical protein